MITPPGLHAMTGCSLFTALLRLTELPASWLTEFIDDAEDIWAEDPFLDDDFVAA